MRELRKETETYDKREIRVGTIIIRNERTPKGDGNKIKISFEEKGVVGIRNERTPKGDGNCE